MASAALVAVTTHVPAPVPVKAEPVTEQNVLPLVTAYEIGPVPEPPDALSVEIPLTRTAAGEALAVRAACAAWFTVTFTVAVAAMKFASAALVTVTVQEPAPRPVR